MKLTKTQLRQIIKEEIKSSTPQAEPLKEYGGFDSTGAQIKITNELLTKILNVLSQTSGGGDIQ